jgi:tRNA (cmo5U34)-methyltransferase
MARRDTLDRMEKASVQLAWLRESGFSSVDIVYKNRMLVVMRGWKR